MSKSEFPNITREPMREAVHPMIGRFGISVHAHNRPTQDSFLLMPSSGVFATADGVSSNQGSMAASEKAVQIVRSRIDNLPPDRDLTPALLDEYMVQTFGEAHNAVLAIKGDDPALKGIRTTLTVAKFLDGNAHLYSVGDSRAYYQDEQQGLFLQATVDDDIIDAALGNTPESREMRQKFSNVISLDELSTEKIDLPKKIYLLRETPESNGSQVRVETDWTNELELFQMKNAVTQTIGGNFREVRRSVVPFTQKSRLIITTDGVENLTEKQMHELMSVHRNPQLASEAVVSAAVTTSLEDKSPTNIRPKKDDIVVIAVDAPPTI